jgi:FtsH-binding integral membrane protein
VGVLLELLFGFLGELLLQVLAEVLFELGLRSIATPFERSPNPYLATVGYVLLGALAGALSLWAFPSLLIVSHVGRIANVVVTPLLAGGAMAALGAWRRRRDDQLVVLDRFAYGYLFSLVMALVRLRFGV